MKRMILRFIHTFTGHPVKDCTPTGLGTLAKRCKCGTIISLSDFFNTPYKTVSRVTN